MFLAKMKMSKWCIIAIIPCKWYPVQKKLWSKAAPKLDVYLCTLCTTKKKKNATRKYVLFCKPPNSELFFQVLNYIPPISTNRYNLYVQNMSFNSFWKSYCFHKNIFYKIKVILMPFSLCVNSLNYFFTDLVKCLSLFG